MLYEIWEWIKNDPIFDQNVCVQKRDGSLSSQMINFRGDAGPKIHPQPGVASPGGKWEGGIPGYPMITQTRRKRKGSGWYKLPTVVGTI